jgi:plasmid stabilization system protein ParE
MGKEYKLQYLPLFEEDLAAARDYIALTLQNPAAALRLVSDTEQAIHKRLKDPLIHAPYPSAKNRELPYYRIQIRNFSVFYVVNGHVMEVRRFVYSKRELSKIV